MKTYVMLAWALEWPGACRHTFLGPAFPNVASLGRSRHVLAVSDFKVSQSSVRFRNTGFLCTQWRRVFYVASRNSSHLSHCANQMKPIQEQSDFQWESPHFMSYPWFLFHLQWLVHHKTGVSYTSSEGRWQGSTEHAKCMEGSLLITFKIKEDSLTWCTML